MMSIVYQKNKKTGTVYVYDAATIWNKETKKPQSIRTYLGKLGKDGNIIPPVKHRSKKNESSDSPADQHAEEKIQQQAQEIAALKREIKKLNGRVEELTKILRTFIHITDSLDTEAEKARKFLESWSDRPARQNQHAPSLSKNFFKPYSLQSV